MAKIRVDEHDIDTLPGENLIDAAARAGVHIPHFCYHPALTVAGNCRQCLVQIEGVGKPQIACNTPPKDGMVVRTDTPEIREAQRGVLEYLLLNHPIDCPICDQAGECRLQEYYMSHGLYDARRNVDKVHKPKVVDLGPLVLLDAERCVLCTRCVRFCDEIAGVDELYVRERGHETEIATFPGKALENPYSGNVVDICPVGALLSKDFRFKSRVWWLKQSNSICTSCARGCNVRVDHHWNRVQRLVPRENPDVNGWWMCDRGRVNYRWINENRLTEAAQGDTQIPLRQALDTLVARLIELDGNVAVLLSPKLCNEDLLVLRHLFTQIYPAKLGAGSLEPAQPEDDILRRADPHPNTWMVRSLGLDVDPRRFVSRAGTKGLLLFGDDPVGWDPDFTALLGGFAFIAAFLTNRNATAAAVAAAGGLLLPLATHAEMAGSFTNCDGRVQRFEPALALLDAALPGMEFGIEIAHGLRREFWPRGAPTDNVLQAVWEHLVPGDAGLSRVSWADVPAHGTVPVWKQTADSRSVMRRPDPMRSGFADGNGGGRGDVRSSRKHG